MEHNLIVLVARIEGMCSGGVRCTSTRHTHASHIAKAFSVFETQIKRSLTGEQLGDNQQ